MFLRISESSDSLEEGVMEHPRPELELVEAKEKPLLEHVLGYAQDRMDYVLRKCGPDVPDEHHEEIRQNSYLRIIDHYGDLDPNRGWKLYVQHHCLGAVLDYLKSGSGFMETRAQRNAAPDRAKSPHLSFRVSLLDENGNEIDVETAAGIHGIFLEAEQGKGFKLNWQLISRMASIDAHIHLIAKLFLGFELDVLSNEFKLTRRRLVQMVDEFFKRLDDPSLVHDKWTTQTIFAFGLCEQFHMKPEDQGVGWEYPPVNLYADESVMQMHLIHQFDLFGGPV